MADPNFKLCDICGGKVDLDCRLFVPTGYSICPAGGHSETEYEKLDLCNKHIWSFLEFMLCGGNSRKADFDLGKKLLDWIKLQSKG